MATVVGESATGDVGQPSPYDDRARSQERGRPISRVYVEGRRPRPEPGRWARRSPIPSHPVTVKDGAS